MILVTGGAFQGKTEFIKTLTEGKDAEVIEKFHLHIRDWLKQEKDAAAETEKLLKLNPDLIIEVTELGCGVVPVDAFDRVWRETTGRISCMLAKQAQAVYRVNCGIDSRLK